MDNRNDPGLPEPRRSVLVLALLAELRTPQDGGALRQGLARSGVPVGPGALHFLLSRLEGQGLVVGDLEDGGSSAARIWRLSESGQRAFAASTARLCGAWYAALGSPEATPAGAPW